MQLKNLFQSDTRPPGDPFAREEPDACCGRHQFCRKELLLKNASQPVEYYDDEELDVFAGRSSDSYNKEEVEQFAEILHTLLETDVSGWMYSLQLRQIELPAVLKEEIPTLINY
jgi:hypothetical protein